MTILYKALVNPQLVFGGLGAIVETIRRTSGYGITDGDVRVTARLINNVWQVEIETADGEGEGES